MNYEQNPVAKTVKIYAGINFAACILFFFMLAGMEFVNGTMAIIWIAMSIVINFGIYAIGEVIQLLDDIKQNTRSSAQTSEAKSVAAVDTSDELPEL